MPQIIFLDVPPVIRYAQGKYDRDILYADQPNPIRAVLVRMRDEQQQLPTFSLRRTYGSRLILNPEIAAARARGEGPIATTTTAGSSPVEGEALSYTSPSAHGEVELDFLKQIRRRGPSLDGSKRATSRYKICEELNKIEATNTRFFALKLMGNVAKDTRSMHAACLRG